MSRFLRSKNVRRDYSRKSFSNPLFERPRVGQGGGRWRGKLIMFVGAIAVAGWTWFVAFSPTFRVTDIRINGADRIPVWEIHDAVTDALKQRRWLLFPQTSLILASESSITSTLNDRFVLESLTITKKPPHTLVIDLKERVSAVLLQLPDGSQGLLDLQGSVTRVYKPEEALDVLPKQGPTLDEQQGHSRPQYPVLFDDKGDTLALRQQAVRPETVQAVINLPKLFDARFNRAPYVAQLHVDGMTSQTLRVVTSEGWAIYLDVTGDLAAQLENAQTILKTKVGPDRKNLDYIDVRFGDKIFFKLK